MQLTYIGTECNNKQEDQCLFMAISKDAIKMGFLILLFDNVGNNYVNYK